MSGKPRNRVYIKIGDRFGDLTVQGLSQRARNNGYFESLADCLCVCGRSARISHTRLRYGSSKACRGCIASAAWKTAKRLPKHELWFIQREKDYRQSAQKRGHVFLLSRDSFRKICRGTCAYCGEFPANGIDRQDNEKGYTLENAVPCCSLCNYAKRDLSLTDFLDWARRVYKFRAGWDRR